MYSAPGVKHWTQAQRPPMEYPPYVCFNPVAYRDRGCEGCGHREWAKCPANGYDWKKRGRGEVYE